MSKGNQMIISEKEMKAEILEKFTSNINVNIESLDELNTKIANLILTISEYENERDISAAELEQLQEKSASELGGLESLKDISGVVTKVQVINQAVQGFETKIDQIKAERETRLEDIKQELQRIFDEIKKPLQQQIDAESERLLGQLEAVDSALKACRQFYTYIPGLENRTELSASGSVYLECPPIALFRYLRDHMHRFA